MKNKIILVGFLAVVLSACADGESPPKQAVQASASCGVTLQAYKLGDDADKSVGGEIKIVKGEGIVLVWSVSSVVSAGLTSVELTSVPTSVLGQKIPLIVTDKKVKQEDGKPDITIKVAEGSREFSNLQEDKISFTIKAVNEEAGKDPNECKGHLDVITTPAPSPPVVTSFGAKASEISAGESTDICFEVPSADVSVTIKDDQENIVYPVPVEKAPVVVPVESPAPTIAPALEPVPALVATGKAEAVSEEGDDVVLPEPQESKEICTTVKPAKTTTYTLTATSASDATLVTTKETIVTVKEVKFEIVSFTANGVEGASMLDKAGEVKLGWEVTPEEAVVTIDNGVGQVKSKDSTTVKVDKAVTYTLTASLGDKSVSKQVTISIAQLVGQNLTVNLTSSATSVFAGEEVAFTWAVTAPEGSSVPADVKYVLDGPEGRQDVTGTTATVKPSVSGSYALEASVGSVPVRSNQVRISVRNWVAADIDAKWSSLNIVSDRLVVAGSLSNESSAIKFGRLTDSGTLEKVSYNFATDFGKIYFESYLLDKLSEYGKFPVNAITKDSESGRLYVALGGGLLFSDDKGQSWGTAEIFALPRGYSLAVDERKSCKGTTQIGDKSGKNTLVNLAQACDVIVLDKRVIVATDLGIIYMDNIDDYMKNRKACWQGLAGTDCARANDPLADIVVNKLLSLGGDVYAGTAKGVWVSKDQGATWAEFNGGDISSGSAVYSLAIDVENKTIYAGGPDGVFSTKLGGGAEWKKLGDVTTDGGVVYSLAVDHDSGAIYVGAEKGVFVSRNFGETWSNVTESMGSAPTVYSLAISKSGSRVGIYAATSGGVFSSVENAVPVVTVEPIVTPPAEPTVTPEPVVPPAPATSLMKSMF